MVKETTRRARGDDSVVSASVGVGNVATDVLEKSSLSRIDYVDHFTITCPAATIASPEPWARVMFGDTPDLTEKLLWARILRLRLDTGASEETIAGWRITGQGDDWVRTSAASRDASAELVVRATREALELATIVRYDRARAPAIWVPVSFVHRQLVPILLRSTVRTMRGLNR